MEGYTKIEKAMAKELKDIPETSILKSIPGVGNITTARFLGEIGSVDNFKDDDTLALYVGLGLLPDESGKKNQRKIKEGKGHWQAVKCLARNMLRVIYAMLKNKTMYQLDFKKQEVKLAEAA